MPAKKFTVLLHNEAVSQLQQAIDYYNAQKKGLGKRFGLAVIQATKKLQTNPHFQIRYDNIRCLPIQKFPFLIHFSIDEKQNKVRIYAILHTARNPDKYPKI